MKDIALDILTHDIYLRNFDLQLVDTLDALRQRINIRLWMFAQEWFLNTSYGLPYFTEILIKNPNYSKVDALFKVEILSIPLVNKILTFSSAADRANRSYTISFSVSTAYGTLESEIIL